MNIRQAIQSSANVIRVTSITAGDFYKRFDQNDDRTYYGIVKNVHNDGEVCIVEAVEYSRRYGSIDINLKNLRGTNDYTLFPADPDELTVEFDEIQATKRREIDRKRDEIGKLEKEIAEIDGLISGETIRSLKAMSYVELSQESYNQKKIAAGL